MTRTTGWHSGPTLGGLKLTSRYTQKPLAASDIREIDAKLEVLNA